MDEVKIKSKLTAAMEEPKAPPALVERTVNRARAIQRGRAAEERMRTAGDTLGRETLRELTAAGVIGRLLQQTVPPDGVTGEMMEKRLLGQPKFRELTEGSASALLGGLEKGSLIRKLGTQEVQRSAPEAKAAAPSPRMPEGPVR